MRTREITKDQHRLNYNNHFIVAWNASEDAVEASKRMKKLGYDIAPSTCSKLASQLRTSGLYLKDMNRTETNLKRKKEAGLKGARSRYGR